MTNNMANNRSNATSVEARGDWKKSLNTNQNPNLSPSLTNQSSSSNILSIYTPISDQQQRLPSFSTNNIQKPGSNPNPKPQFTND